MFKRRAKAYFSEGVKGSDRGTILTDGLVTCVACAGYLRGSESRPPYVVLNHDFFWKPEKQLTNLSRFISGRPELQGRDIEFVLFRLGEPNKSDNGLGHEDETGNTLTYRQYLDRLEQGLLGMFPGSRVREQSYDSRALTKLGGGNYRGEGHVDINVGSGSWRTNMESGKF